MRLMIHFPTPPTLRSILYSLHEFPPVYGSEALDQRRMSRTQGGMGGLILFSSYFGIIQVKFIRN